VTALTKRMASVGLVLSSVSVPHLVRAVSVAQQSVDPVDLGVGEPGGLEMSHDSRGMDDVPVVEVLAAENGVSAEVEPHGVRVSRA